jgi:hypothetical protein
VVHAAWLATSVLLVSTAAPSSARGEERAIPASSETSERDRAAQYFAEGRSAYMAGRLHEAELLYLKAWRLMKSYDIAANLGQVQLLLKKPASAARYLAFSVRTVGPEIEPERLRRIEAQLAVATAQVGALRVQVTNVPDAEVLVDGGRVAAEEVKHEIYVEPGKHVIVIRRAGYQEVVLPVLARAGSREAIGVAMKPLAAEAKAAAAAPPEAKAPLAQRAPAAGGPPAVGKERPRAPAAGAGVDEPRSWVPVIALGAASAVGLGVAVELTVASNDASADVDRQTREILRAGGQCAKPTDAFVARCAALRRTGQRADAFGDAARVAYVAAGALAVATVGYVFWARSTPSRPAPVSARLDVRRNAVSVGAMGMW